MMKIDLKKQQTNPFKKKKVLSELSPSILLRSCGYECPERPTWTFQVSCLIFLKVAVM